MENTLDPSINSNASRVTKKQLERRELTRKVKQKIKDRLLAHADPLYMTIPNVLRVIRALEIGQPEAQQIIVVIMKVIRNKGVTKWNGDIQLPHPLKAMLKQWF